MKLDGIKALEREASQSPTAGEVAAQVAEVRQKTTKTNKPYLEIVFADAESSCTLKVWDNAPWYADCAALEPGMSVGVSATWRRGDFGIEASDLVLRPLSPAEEEELMAGSAELRDKQRQDWNRVLEFAASMRDPRLHALCALFLQTFEKRLRRAAAARTYHHARRGGLVEHIAGMMRCADKVAEAYPHLNRDLLLAGCLFHDCGKLWENNYGESDFTMAYAETGEMLGHIALGIELVNKLWNRLTATPEAAAWAQLQPPSDKVRLHLLHLVAAHHGELQFGSPVPPKTPEAAALHYIDNLDAKLEMFRGAYETSAPLAPGILQRKAPLPGNVITPLPAVPPPGPHGS